MAKKRPSTSAHREKYHDKKKDLSSIKRKNFFKNNLATFVVLGVLIVIGAIVYFSSGGEDNRIFGDDVIEMHFFHLSTCPHCHRQIAFHPYLEEKYPNLKIIEYEITLAASKEAYSQFASKPEFEGQVDPVRISTPTTFIGNRVIVGYGSEDTTGAILEEMIIEEQARIEANWDPATMIRTTDLREQIAN